MSEIIVLGASGQLGQCLKQVAAELHVRDIYFTGRSEADILNTDVLEKLFAEHKPAFCINCAAYTAVDKAEDEADLARQINKDGAAHLARLCKTHHTTLIYISTDFVFDGASPHPLTETDDTQPINVYGQTKLEGEQVIAELLPAHYIIRTSWLYSEYGNNFVKTMLRLGKEKEELKIIADQVGTPTYAIDLAKCIFNIIASNAGEYGVYHYSNEGVASWYDFAKAAFSLSHTTIKVLPVRTAEYVTKAVRPAYSVMDKAKIKSVFKLEVPYWRDSLEHCIMRLAVQQS